MREENDVIPTVQALSVKFSAVAAAAQLSQYIKVVLSSLKNSNNNSNNVATFSSGRKCALNAICILLQQQQKQTEFDRL